MLKIVWEGKVWARSADRGEVPGRAILQENGTLLFQQMLEKDVTGKDVWTRWIYRDDLAGPPEQAPAQFLKDMGALLAGQPDVKVVSRVEPDDALKAVERLAGWLQDHVRRLFPKDSAEGMHFNDKMARITAGCKHIRTGHRETVHARHILEV